MEKFFKIILIIFIIFFAGIIVYIQKDFIISYFEFNPIIKSTMTGVIVKVNENNLDVLGENGDFDLYWVSFGKEGNIGFKQGQEIEIYYNGYVVQTFPASPGGVTKIKIIKEESDKQIPDDVIRYFYNSMDKVKINVTELNNKGITLQIIDTNALPYEYTGEYWINMKVKNPEFPRPGRKIGENTKNSTAGYEAPAPEYISKEVDKISNISCEETEENVVYNLQNIQVGENYKVIGKKFNWEKLYGTLEKGEYGFTYIVNNGFLVNIHFILNDSGEVEEFNIQTIP